MSQDKPTRILDAATALLVRYGYRHVTVDEVARTAGVGKGTVYLYWHTKDQLFEAVLLREAIGYLDGLVKSLREDSSTVLPHRLTAASFRLVQGKPVLRDMFTMDSQQARLMMPDNAMRGHELLTTTKLLDLLARHGLLRQDAPNAGYAWKAIQAGFHLLATLDPAAAELDVHAQADSLAGVVRAALEPAGEPDPRAVELAATQLIDLLEEMLPPYREWIYPSTPKSR